MLKPQELLIPNPQAVTDSFEELTQTLTDLDMHDILCLIDPRLSGKSAAEFAGRYFSSDPEEISLRLAFIRDLADATTAAQVQEGIDALDALAAEDQKATVASGRFTQVLYRWRRFAAYVRLIKLWNHILETPGQSVRYQALSGAFRDLLEEPLFARLEETLDELDRTLPLPRYLWLGFNMREDGYPQEMGILSTEGHIDLRDEAATEDKPLNAILAFDDPSQPSDGLGPEFVYHRGIYGSHFDEYIERAVEKEWRSEIGKADKLLEKFGGRGSEPLPALKDLLALREALSFYQVALLSQEAFLSRGYALCSPEPREDATLDIEGALYPDFILRHEGIQGNDLTLKRGNAVIITGANHSGKTSYLKTIGQCTVLAQLGFFVPARKMVFTPVKHIFTLFSAGEDSSMNASRMGLEVKKLTAILKRANSDDLILLNEPMTSTNPVEAVSICADMVRHFLEEDITHLLVTHLYDIYFLLKAELPAPLLARLDSLVTQSEYDAESGQMVHAYKLYYHEPLGNSYARETATAYGITLEDMIGSGDLLSEARTYLDEHSIDSIYEGGKADGISDDD